jgi:hypothetical protein
VAAVENAIRQAAFILEQIDRRRQNLRYPRRYRVTADISCRIPPCTIRQKSLNILLQRRGCCVRNLALVTDRECQLAFRVVHLNRLITLRFVGPTEGPLRVSDRSTLPKKLSAGQIRKPAKTLRETYSNFGIQAEDSSRVA